LDALQFVAEHARVYANGQFAEERDALAIEALVAAGRQRIAASQLSRFRATYPKSIHLQRIEALLER
jgi:hypothetical protein